MRCFCCFSSTESVHLHFSEFECDDLIDDGRNTRCVAHPPTPSRPRTNLLEIRKVFSFSLSIQIPLLTTTTTTTNRRGKGISFFFVLRPFNVVCVLVRNRKWNSRRAIEGRGGARTFIQMPFLRKVAARSTICLNFVYLISSLYYIRNCFCSIALTQTTRVTQLSHTNVYKWQLMH